MEKGDFELLEAWRAGEKEAGSTLLRRHFMSVYSFFANKVGDTAEEFRVSGRGLLHLGILLENMRREGYELSVGRPEVIEKTIDGVRCEPIEMLTVDVNQARLDRPRGAERHLPGDAVSNNVVRLHCARVLRVHQTEWFVGHGIFGSFDWMAAPEMSAPAS